MTRSAIYSAVATLILSMLVAYHAQAGFGFGVGGEGGSPGGFSIFKKIKQIQDNPWAHQNYQFARFRPELSDGFKQKINVALVYGRDPKTKQRFLAVNTLMENGWGLLCAKRDCYPTYKSVYLQDPRGNRIYPTGYIITERWAKVGISISVTTSHYKNGQLVSSSTSTSSYSYNKFLGRDVSKVRMEGPPQVAPPPIYETFKEEPCGSVRGLISLFPIPAESAGKIGKAILVVVVTAPPGKPTTTVKFTPGEVTKSEKMVKVPVEIAGPPVYTEEPSAPAGKKQVSVPPAPKSGLLVPQRSMVNKLMGSPLVVYGEKDPCAECNKVAKELKKKQGELLGKMASLQDSLAKAEAKKADLEKDTPRLKKELKDAKAQADAAQKGYDAERKAQERYQKSVVDRVNRAAGRGSAQLGTFDAPPAGAAATVGMNNGVFPLAAGQGVHLKNDSAVEEYLKQIKKARETSETFQENIDKAQDKLDKANDALAKAQKGLDDNIKEKAKTDSEIAKIKKEMESVRAANDELNGLIEQVNERCKKCEQIVAKIMADKPLAEKAIAAAQSASTVAPDPDSYPEAHDSYKSAGDLLTRAKDLYAQGVYPQAKDLAQKASNLFSQARNEKRLTDCIKTMERNLTQGKVALKEFNKREKCCRLHDVEDEIKTLERDIRDAKKQLRLHNPQGGLDICSGAARDIPGHIARSKERCLKKKLDRLDNRGDATRAERGKSIFNDPEVLQTLQDIKDVLKEGTENLDEFKGYIEGFDEWLERAEKVGLLKLVEGKKTPTKLLDSLKKSSKLTKAQIDQAKGVEKQAIELIEELEDMIEKGAWNYFKEKASDQLKEKAIELSAKLAARGLGGSVAGPFAAIWGEAYDVGEAVGNRIVELIDGIQSQELAKAAKFGDLCNNRKDASAVQIYHAVPVVYDVYVEIYDGCRTLLTGAVADISIARSKKRVYKSEISLGNGQSGEVESNNMTHLPWRPRDIKIDVTCPNGSKPSSVEYVRTIKRICEEGRVRVVINLEVHTKGCKR